MQEIRVENIEKNELISDIMKQITEYVNVEANVTELKTITIEQTKDMGMIESFLISVAADVFLDAIKYVIKLIKNRDNYNDDAKIKIGDKIYSLHEIEEDLVDIDDK